MKDAQVNNNNHSHYSTLYSFINSFSESPQNITLTAIASDKLELSWLPPQDFPATLYIVLFQGTTYHIDPSSDLVMELGSLMTYTSYSCCVAANTASGASRIECATQTTLETGMLKINDCNPRVMGLS